MYPKYLSITLLVYVFFLLLDAAFIESAMRAGAAAYDSFYYAVLLIFAPAFLFAAYYFGDDIAVVRDHRQIFGLLFTAVAWISIMFSFIVILPITYA